MSRPAGTPGDSLEVPTLLVFGHRYFGMPTRVVRQHAERTPAIELGLVPGAGHFIVDERPSSSPTAR